ncbi:unnamed protein product [Closterium sp. NIES-64]|nr:unnamed protein product [Closterium sp. NIES-64]
MGARAMEELAGAVEAAVEAVVGVGVAVGVVAGVGALVEAVEAEEAAVVAVPAEVAEVEAVVEVAAAEVELVGHDPNRRNADSSLSIMSVAATEVGAYSSFNTVHAFGLHSTFGSRCMTW